MHREDHAGHARDPDRARRGLAPQAGLLAGLALALAVAGGREPAIAAQNECPEEDQCSFKKPVFLIVMDYSTSMNTPFDALTRWQAAVDSVTSLVAADNEFVSRNMLLGLLRFGHDPDPDAPGTLIDGDASGIVDGQAVDVAWFDADMDNAYTPCNGPALAAALAATPAPLDGMPGGIGTWTRGALLRARALMETSLAAHPEDAPGQDNRAYLQLVMTDGEWTDPEGSGQSPEHDPAPAAADMFNAGIGAPDDPTFVTTYVVYFGDLMGAGEADADALAAAGGTTEALVAEDPMALTSALQDVVQDIKDSIISPDCTSGLPRIMVLVDASSSMLNGGYNEYPAPKGTSGWDQARFALAGDPQGQNLSLFDQEVLGPDMTPTGSTVEDFALLGLAVFGTDAPAEERLLVQYGACRQDNFYWAMSPELSHPGCPKTDYTPLELNPATPMRTLIEPCDLPWDGAPIVWHSPAVIAGSPGPLDDPPGPGFDDDTIAHMPRCDIGLDIEPTVCTGSGTFTHLGLQLLQDNQAAYHAQAVANAEADASTQYVNILITDGQYFGYSTDAQVAAPLVAMATGGIPTFVVGFGSGLDSPEAQAQLASMADWGGTAQPYYAESQVELESALADIIEGLNFDPCCQFNDCSQNPEPSTGEGDPLGDCSVDDDCLPLEVCVAGECQPAPCEQDDDCGAAKPPLVCEDGACAPGPCASSSECPGSQVCEDGKCVGSGACNGDDQCPPTEICEDGECRPRPCVESWECGLGLECEDGVCVPATPETTGWTGWDPTDGYDAEAGGASYGSYGSTDAGGDSVGFDDGCGCASTGDPSRRGGWLALLGLALWAWPRRRAGGRGRPRGPAGGRASTPAATSSDSK